MRHDRTPGHLIAHHSEIGGIPPIDRLGRQRLRLGLGGPRVDFSGLADATFAGTLGAAFLAMGV